MVAEAPGVFSRPDAASRAWRRSPARASRGSVVGAMQAIRNLIKRALLRRDVILSRPPGQFSITELKLAKVRDRGLRVKMAVDGGAAEGAWAEELKEIFPDAKLLCIEPREDAQAELRARAARVPGMTVAQTLLGPEHKHIDFYESSHQSSVLKDAQGQDWGKKISTPMTTLDALVAKLGLPDPDLIKLDLQGYELEALKGASRCLESASAVLLEVTLIPFQSGMPLIGDVVPFMASRGYRVYDITALWHRPLDGALAQGDFLFVPDRSPLVADTRWEAT
jgi:FkbM family methyltransferase